MKLRVHHEDADHRLKPFPDIIGNDGKALGRHVMGLEEASHSLEHPVFKPLLVGAAVRCGNGVGVGSNVFAVVFSPLQRDLNARDRSFRLVENDRNRVGMNRRLFALFLDSVEQIACPTFVLELLVGAGALVSKENTKSRDEESLNLKTFRDVLHVEHGVFKDFRVGTKEDFGARTARLTDGLHARIWRPTHISLPVGMTVTLDRGDEFRAQGVDHRATHTVQSTRGGVRGVVELSAGMQGGENHLEGASFLGILRVCVHRNSAPVVHHSGRAAVFVDGNLDGAGKAVHGFVNRVVDDFPEEVMESSLSRSSDIHRRTFSHGLKAR